MLSVDPQPSTGPRHMLSFEIFILFSSHLLWFSYIFFPLMNSCFFVAKIVLLIISFLAAMMSVLVTEIESFAIIFSRMAVNTL